MVYQIFLKAIILFCHSKKYITACMSKISFNNNSILSLKEVQNIDGPFKISCSNYSVLSLKEVHNMACIWKISSKNNSVLSLKGVQNYLISL